MVLGDEVKGVMTAGARFVTSDANKIAERVREENSQARLVRLPSGQLGIVEWFPREKMGEGDVESKAGVPVQALGGQWFLSLMLTDAQGEPMTGEPDARVITEMQKFDVRKRGFNMAAVRRLQESAQRSYEEQERKRVEEASMETAEKFVHAYANEATGKRRGHRIYVPQGVARGID